MDCSKTNEHCERRNNFEIDKRFHTHPPDLLQIGMTSDTDNQSPEEQGCNDDFDQTKKDCAKNLKGESRGWPVMAELRSGERSQENPHRERFPLERITSECQKAYPAHEGSAAGKRRQ